MNHCQLKWKGSAAHQGVFRPKGLPNDEEEETKKTNNERHYYVRRLPAKLDAS